MTYPTPGGQPVPSPQPTYVTTVGDIGVTPDWVVTPRGSAPLRGSTWYVRNLYVQEEAIATWALVLAIVGFFVVCVLSLLLLLVKETKVTGMVEVTVTSGELTYATQLPVSSLFHVQQIHQAVAIAQHYAAA